MVQPKSVFEIENNFVHIIQLVMNKEIYRGVTMNKSSVSFVKYMFDEDPK
jgi:hypothetical protein